MPTLVATARVWSRISDAWLQNWEKISHTSNLDMIKHLKKLLVRYPKNAKALKFLALRLQGLPNEPGEAVNHQMLQLVKPILAKYNKGFIRQIEISDHRSFPLLRKVNLASATSIKLVEPGPGLKKLKKNLLHTVKSLHSLEIDVSESGEFPSYYLKKYLYHIKSVNSLTLTNLTYLPLEQYKRLFRHLKNNIKCLTITGGLWNEFHAYPQQYLSLLEFFFNLPKLQVFRFDATLPRDVNISDLPLDILKQRGVKFDVRTLNSGAETSQLVSSKNTQALSEVQFLGINTQAQFLEPCTNWDEIEEAHLKIQNSTKGDLFYVNRLAIDSASGALFNLFNTCKNITTLNMILSSLTENLDFAPLAELSNVENIFVQFYKCQKPPGNLWKNLEALAQNHKKIQFVSFDFQHSKVGEDFAQVQDFFEASKDILQKVILKFKIKENMTGVKCFYQGLQKLNQITSLSILMDMPAQVQGNPQECYTGLLKDVLENLNSLTELNLHLPFMNIQDMAINPSKSLKKMSLDINGRKPELALLENVPKLKDLQQLDLKVLGLEQETWTNLYKTIENFGQLEIIRLRLQNQFFKISVENFELLMKEKKKYQVFIG